LSDLARAHALPPPTAHQFDDAIQQQDASILGMWVFLLTEILFFGGLFCAYAVYRWLYPTAFAAGSEHLDIVLGTINTAVLIGSSVTMALAVHTAQVSRNGRVVALFLVLTIVLGGIFLGIKAVEYAHKFHEHHVPGPYFHFGEGEPRQMELFFALYFIMTGLHALHMVIGIGILGVLTVMALRGRFGPDYFTPVEITGLYWHFVDIIWIFLFPLLYLVARHA